ncbi:MAG: hypothetical protein LBE20_04335 [Deltaproteobacteria bacterium]|jgi:hypothetical protein|nr:hypothetical protein [Deltaproteobacteria bacterium]
MNLKISFLVFWLFFNVAAAYSQVAKHPEKTWNNMLKSIIQLPAKQAFHEVCNYVEWNLMFEEIKEENNQFLVKQKIKSAEELKIYTQKALAQIIDGSKGLAKLLQKPFLYDLFLKGLQATGSENFQELEKANAQYAAELNQGTKLAAFGIDKIIADLDKPSNYLKFEVLKIVKNNKMAEMWVKATDTRTGISQQMLFFFVKTGGKMYLRSYAPDELFKNFDPRIDSLDMQRVLRLARLLAKFA